MEPNQLRIHRNYCSSQASSESSTGSGSNVPLWRPWHGNCGTHVAVQNVPSTLQLSRVDESHTLHREKPSAFQHPVKLFWPQSRCYDFLYQEAENLLRNFPVQATISLYQETDSDSSSDGEEPLDN